MKQFLSLSILSFLLISLSTSQNSSISYIEGCATYAQDGSCLVCQYAYSLASGKCIQNSQNTADCCATYNSDGSCSQCSLGLYYADPYCYRNQIYGCIKKSGDACLACGNGFNLQNSTCLPNIPNCANFKNGICINCVTGYSLINSYCILNPPQIPNCDQSSYSGCVICSNGYFLTKSLTCLPYALGCVKYYRQQCIACLLPFQLTDGICIIEGCDSFSQNGCSKCKSQYQLQNGKCFWNNCARQINGKCLACKPSYRLSANGCVKQAPFVCQACQPGYIFNVNKCIVKLFGCINYTLTNLCNSCKSNFNLTVNGVCQIIGCSQYNDDGCVLCNPSFQLQSGICTIPNCQAISSSGCTICNQGYILNNNACYLADPNCLAYLGSVCGQCKDKYHLVNGLCVVNQRGCIYDSVGTCTCGGSFIVSSSNQCVLTGCSLYDSNDHCLTCITPYTLNTTNGFCYINNCQIYTQSSCKACFPGFNLINGLCQQSDIYCLSYNSNGKCQSCQAGFFLNPTTEKCIKNIENCAVYCDQITCQTCKNGYLLYNGSCITIIANCYSQVGQVCMNCAAGYYINNNRCLVNDPYCQNYTLLNSSQYCTTCINGYQLLQGICIKIQAGCIYNGTVCASCSQPFIFNPSDNSCYMSGCITYSSSGCTSCNLPFVLSGNTCFINNCLNYTRNGCVLCQNGFSLTNGSCLIIDQNCLSFGTDNLCTSCKSGYSIFKGKCVISVPFCTSYNPDGTCSICQDNYFLDNNRRCKPKQIGCIYEGGVCKYCNPPFVLNPVANSCVIKNCLQVSSAGCITCEGSFIVQNGACALPNCNIILNNICMQCKAGYHKKAGSCEIDSSDCLSYDQDGNCQLCKKGLTLNSNAVCSQLNSTCLQTCQSDKFKCLACATGYFLNKFYQCEKQDGKCVQYTNGVCSKCSQRFFLFSEICFPYTAGCVQYSGKDCVVCKKNYVLKNGECFYWSQQGIGVLGDNDKYNFSITPVDVRQSKYYIKNLSPGSALGKFFFSSSFDRTYEDCSLSALDGAIGKGWKSLVADSAQFIGLVINDEPVTFYAIQLQAVEGNYITEFYLEYSTDGTNFIRVQNSFTVATSIKTNLTTIYFTGIYAKAIRIKISKFQGWPSCRIDFFYYDLIRYRKISNLKSLKYLQETINSTFVDRVDNQIYINQAYFFNPTASCSSKEMCFTGLQLCQPRNVNSLALSFGNNGTVTEFYLTYSIDGRSYNCYNACAKIVVNTTPNNIFNYNLNNLKAQGVRIYPTKFAGSSSFSPIFYYD